MLNFITWDVDPEAINILGREIRWYGICWALALLFTSYIVQQIYKSEKLPEKWFDKLFLYVALSLIIGARVGHCLMYDPAKYLSNPLDIIKIWEGGLASHGGAIGMTIGVCLYALSITKQKMNWKHFFIMGGIFLFSSIALYYILSAIGFIGADAKFTLRDFIVIGTLIGFCVSMIYETSETTIPTLDRLIIGVTLGAASIRIGNLMNSEIFGYQTEMPWGFNFLRSDLWNTAIAKGGAGQLPCHPTQIYEALIYIALLGVGLFMYYKTNAKERKGLILGVLLIGIFFSRFLIEFLKFVQEPFEIHMREMIGINMGQLLSLPFVIWGVFLVYNTLNKKKEENTIKSLNKKTDNVKTNSNKR